MYRVREIGDLTGPLAGQPPLPIPAGWVPAGTPDRAGLPPSPVPVVALAVPPPTSNASGLALAAVIGVAAGAFGLWALQRWA